MRPERPIWERQLLDERPGFVATALGGANAVQRFSRNPVGRDFVVGDIHGRYRSLAHFLHGLAFDPATDRLFAVGDLVDRGPDSPAALTWLNEYPWFYSVRGNHDQMLLDSEAERRGIHGEEWSVWALNGNDWWEFVPDLQRREFAGCFARLPFAIEIECECGIVAVVHADVPEDRTWDAFCDALQAGSREDSYHAIWSRRRWERLAVSAAGGIVPPVEGTPVQVICGHLAVPDVLKRANIWNIDTGAGRCLANRAVLGSPDSSGAGGAVSECADHGLTESAGEGKAMKIVTTLAEGKAAPVEPGRISALVAERGELELRYYAPGGTDPQTPHTRDEIYVVIAGTGTFCCGDERESFGPGDVVFAPAGAEHRFANFSDDFAVWVVFYGPEGGDPTA